MSEKPRVAYREGEGIYRVTRVARRRLVVHKGLNLPMVEWEETGEFDRFLTGPCPTLEALLEAERPA